MLLPESTDTKEPPKVELSIATKVGKKVCTNTLCFASVKIKSLKIKSSVNNV